MKRPLWTLEQAVQFIIVIQSEAFKVNYYLALAGGVLNNGQSHNDLDLVAVNNHPDSSAEVLKEALDTVLKRTSTMKVLNNRVKLKWESLRVECMVIERLPRE